MATPSAQTTPCLRELPAASWAVVKKLGPGVTTATAQSRARGSGAAYRRCWVSIKDYLVTRNPRADGLKTLHTTFSAFSAVFQRFLGLMVIFRVIFKLHHGLLCFAQFYV